jgi:chromosome segregation ATPase
MYASEQEALEARRERDEIQENLTLTETALSEARMSMHRLQQELTSARRELEDSEAKARVTL